MSDEIAVKTMNRWLVVVGAILIQLSLGAIYAWSVFTPPLVEAAWTKAQTQGVFAAGLASFAIVMVFAGRKLATHIRKRKRVEAEAKKKSYIDKFIPHIGIALKDILGFSDREEKKVVDKLRHTLERSREHLG